MLQLLISLLLIGVTATTVRSDAQFAVATTATPVLNTPDFKGVFGGSDGKTLRADACGQLRALEFVALPGTVFSVEQTLTNGGNTVYRVTSGDYPYPSSTGYFVDGRWLRLEPSRPEERARSLPARAAILAALKTRVGSRYVWGGNVAAGVAELAAWYPPTGAVDRKLWQLAGVDCSGLLYEATNGFTPRNTSALLTFGTAVAVAGSSVQEIAALLKPLDLIVWPGHVLIVLDGGQLIESHLVCARPEAGVRIRPLESALTEIMNRRRPVNRITKGTQEFVVRRWYLSAP